MSCLDGDLHRCATRCPPRQDSITRCVQACDQLSPSAGTSVAMLPPLWIFVVTWFIITTDTWRGCDSRRS